MYICRLEMTMRINDSAKKKNCLFQITVSLINYLTHKQKYFIQTMKLSQACEFDGSSCNPVYIYNCICICTYTNVCPLV